MRFKDRSRGNKMFTYRLSKAILGAVARVFESSANEATQIRGDVWQDAIHILFLPHSPKGHGST